MLCIIPILACFSSHKSIFFEVGGVRRLRSAVEWQRSDDCRAGPEIGGGFCLRFTFTAAGRVLLKSIPVFWVAAALFISRRHGGHGVFCCWGGCGGVAQFSVGSRRASKRPSFISTTKLELGGMASLAEARFPLASRRMAYPRRREA